MIRGGFVLLATMAVTCSQPVCAQAPDQSGNSVRVGDQWTYSRKDEITGIDGDSYTATVTEITPQEIVTTVATQGKEESIVQAFDHDWNTLANGTWRYKPHDGPGIRLPLEVGKEWRSEYFQINAATNVRLKTSSITKVSGRETITTPVGSFDAFKVERQARAYNIAAPSIVSEAKVVLWYAPEVNHWVRRNAVMKVEKRTRSNVTEELAAFHHKE